MRHLPLILTLFAVVSCTREQPRGAFEGPEPSAPPAQHVRATPVTEAGAAVEALPIIVAFGDSLSEGKGVGHGESFPEILQEKLDSAGYKYRIVNMGVGGDTTTGGLTRVHTVVALKPEVVLLELCGNDGLRGVPVAATKANLEQIIQALKAGGVSRTVLAGMSLPPNYGPQYIQAFEKMYRELAAKYKLTFIPFLFEDIAKNLGSQPGLMQPDGIHPSSAGHKVMAETVFRYLEPVLRQE
jgi:acyl-CoA thioesterase-1